MTTLHNWGAWVTIAITGVVGLWGVIGGVRAFPTSRWYRIAIAAAATVTVLHIGTGVYLYTQTGVDPGDQHLFYGVVMAFTLAFAYIFRAQLEIQPMLRYGLFWLFIMGLGLRTVQTFGVGF